MYCVLIFIHISLTCIVSIQILHHKYICTIDEHFALNFQKKKNVRKLNATISNTCKSRGIGNLVKG